MNKFNINMIVLAVSLACSAGAMAQNLSKAEFKSGKGKIAAEYKSARMACTSLSGNANDICVAEAKGKEKMALADLDNSYKPTQKTHYQVLFAKAEADYAVSREKCDDLAATAKDVCVKEAKAAESSAKADATAQMKISKANTTASETVADARNKAAGKAVDARKDATADKRDAEYSVAKEKCETFAGSAKDSCLIQAKKQFSK